MEIIDLMKKKQEKVSQEKINRIINQVVFLAMHDITQEINSCGKILAGRRDIYESLSDIDPACITAIIFEMELHAGNLLRYAEMLKKEHEKRYPNVSELREKAKKYIAEDDRYQEKRKPIVWQYFDNVLGVSDEEEEEEEFWFVETNT